MTKLQQEMITRIVRSDYNPVNGGEPETAADTVTWLDCIIESPADNGTIVSLQNAGLVEVSGRGRDAGIGLTDLGLAAYITLKAAKAAEVTTC